MERNNELKDDNQFQIVPNNLFEKIPVFRA